MTQLRLRPLLTACGLAALAALLQWAIEPWVGTRAPFLFFLPLLIIAAALLGRAAAMIVLLAGAVNAMFLFPPRGSFAMSSMGDSVALAMYLVVGLMLVIYGSRLRLMRESAAQTEERLRLALEDTGFGTFELDYRANLARVSPTLCRLVEQPVVDSPLPLDRWLGMLSADHVDESRETLAQKMKDGTLRYERELQLKLPDGRIRWLLTRVRVDAGPDGELIRARGVTEDITQRVELDSALGQTRSQLMQRLEDLDRLHQCSTKLHGCAALPEQMAIILEAVREMHAAPMGLISLRESKGGALSFAAHWGFSEAALEAMPEIASTCDAAGRAWAVGQRFIVEDTEIDSDFACFRELARREGYRAAHSTPLLSHSGEVLGILSVHFKEPRRPTEREIRLADIYAGKAAALIERFRAQAEAASRDQRFKVALESSAVPFDIMTPVRDSSGRIVDFSLEYVNPAGARAFLRSAAELVGQPLAGMLPNVWNADGLFDRYCAVVERGEMQEFDLHSTADGIDAWFHVVASPLQQSAAVWFADITERKQQDQMLQEADQRKDEFIATLAHELRNPLAPVRHAAAIARAETATAEQRRWGYEVIDRQVQHMSLLLDDLLEVSRVARGTLRLRKQSIDLSSAVRAAAETLRPLIEARQHELILHLPPEPVWFEADPLRVEQIIGNLLTNAAKYTDGGGRIGVSAGCNGEQVWIEVADNGIGIRPEALQAVFEMFTQVKPDEARSSGGLGIGLALSQKLVNLHGGSIEAHSDGPGTGSRFIVRLPVGSPASLENPLPEIQSTSVKGGRRVLVADDNCDAADTLAEILRLEGFEVVVAFDGETALLEFSNFEPDVALIDICMPKLSGHDVARAIHRNPAIPKPRLIALSGLGQESDKRNTAAAGFDHHMTKPVDLPTLLRVLAE